MRPRASPLPCPPRLRGATWALAGWLGVFIAIDPAHAGPPPLASPEDVLRDMKGQRLDVALEPDGGGRLHHRGDGFTAIIHHDGSVEFRDHGGTVGLSFLGFDLGRQRFQEPARERHDPSWAALRDRAFYPMGQMPIMLDLGVRFGGLADGPRKRRHSSAKRGFLAATEPLRLRLARAWYRARLLAQVADLGVELAGVWRDPKLSPEERRQLLFRRWEECEEAGAGMQSEIDAIRVEAGRSTRAKIEAFVRQVAPYGSPQGYTEAELERLNQGRDGRPRFRPYDAPILKEDERAEVELGTSHVGLPPRSGG